MSRSIYRSFAGGEITPELVARADLPQNQTGLALCENMLVQQNGTLVRRGGLRHIMTVGRMSAANALFTRPTIIPVALKNGDHMGVIAGTGPNNAVPLVYNGTAVAAGFAILSSIAGNVLTISTAVASPLPNLFLRSPRSGTHVFRIESQTGVLPVANLVLRDLDTSIMSADRVQYFFGGFLGESVAIASSIASANLQGLHGASYRYSQDNDVLTYTKTDVAGVTSGDIQVFSPPSFTPGGVESVITFSAVVNPPATVTATATVASGSGLIADRYYVASIGPDQVSESATTASAGTATNLLETAGNYNTISWTAPASGPTPVAYRVYLAPANSSLRLYLGETSGLTFIHDKKTPVDNVSKPVSLFPGYPSHPAVAHHEQRRWFSGADAQQQTVIASRIGSQNNYSSSFPLRADDALTFRLNSTQQAGVRHLVPFVDLLAFTQSNVFRIFSPTNGAITPSSLAAKPQGNVGANFVQPVITPSSVMFAQAGGDKLRELQYVSQGTGAFATLDVSAIAAHLFYNRTVTSLTYAQAPNSVVWALNAEGPTSGALDSVPLTSRLLGMTYSAELEMRAWHRHSVTAGDYVLCCTALRESNRDRLYLLVARKTLDTDGYDICLERMEEPNTRPDPYDGAHLDQHYFFRAGAVSAFAGLFHLAGRTVQVLGDGAVYPSVPVSAAGVITLPAAFTSVVVGVPYASRVQTLPMWADNAGSTKNANAVRIRILNSSFLRAGPAFDKLTEHVARQVSTPFDTAQPLRTYEARMAIGPSWNNDGSVCIEQSLALPLTVCGFVVDYAQGS